MEEEYDLIPTMPNVLGARIAKAVVFWRVANIIVRRRSCLKMQFIKAGMQCNIGRLGCLFGRCVGFVGVG